MDRHHHRHRHQQQQQQQQHHNDDGGAECEEGQLQSSPYGGGGGGRRNEMVDRRLTHRDHHDANSMDDDDDDGGGGGDRGHNDDRDDDDGMGDEDTADSLDIKPPQATGAHQLRYRDKTKKSSSSSGGQQVVASTRIGGKHSKEHHRSDHHHTRRRSRDAEHRSEHRSSGNSSSSRRGGGGGGYADHHNRDVQRSDQRVQQHQQPPSAEQQQHQRYEHYRSAAPTGAVYKEHREREKSGRKPAADSPEKSDAERALEDLRSRLLSKRNKYDAEKRAAAEHLEVDYRSEDHHHQHHQQQQQQQPSHRDAYRYEQHPHDHQPSVQPRHRDKEHRHHNSDQAAGHYSRSNRSDPNHSGSKRNVIDLDDSPNDSYHQHPTGGNYNQAHIERYPAQSWRGGDGGSTGTAIRRPSDTGSNGKQSTHINDATAPSATTFVDDPELNARRAKLLAADHERERRRDVARDELEARRVQRRRERDAVPADVIVADDDDDEDDMIEDPVVVVEEKRPHSGKSKRSKHGSGRRSADSVVHVSDDEDVRQPAARHRMERNDSDNNSGTEDSDNSSSSSSSGSNSDEEDDDEDDDDDDDRSPRKAKAKASDESDGELPVTPPSVGELSKSERRQQRRDSRDSRRRSQTRSPVSRSRSPDSRSKSPHRRSSQRSSRTRSRSHSSRSAHSRSSRSATNSPGSAAAARIKRSRSPSSDYEHRLRTTKRPPNPGAVPPPALITSVPPPSIPQPSAAELAAEEAAARAALLPNYFPGVQGCRSVEEFQCLNRIEEGTYGVVYRARDKRTDEIVALKRLKMEKEKEGFPITSLREINTLLKGQHPNIVTVREIVVGSNMDKIFIVMDYVEHDLKSLMETMRHRKQSFLPGEVKCLTQQLLRAVGHLHDNWILHRDLKTSNLLLSHKGILKVGDFGLAREYGSPLKPYTSVVVTLWYRAPELLLCCKEYSHPIDMWSLGCIFAEFLAMGALFPGKSEVDQLSRIFKDLGTPNEKIWPGYSELPAVQKMTFTEYPVSHLRKKFAHLTSEMGLQLLQGLLTYDPKQRFSAEQGLRSAYFRELPLPIDPAMFPTWPAKSELGARKALASSPKPPSGGGQYKQLQAGDGLELMGGQAMHEAPESRGFVLNAGMMGGAGVGLDGRSGMPQQGGGFSLKF